MTLYTRVVAVALATSGVALLTWRIASSRLAASGTLGVTFVLLATTATTLGAALALSAILTRWVRRRTERIDQRIRGTLERTARPEMADVVADEIGRLARALDDTAAAFVEGLRGVSRERTQAVAALATMSEGILVTDRDGHVQLVNQAAISMLQIEGQARGSHYLEIVREPAVGDGLANALEGRAVDVGEVTPAGATDRRLLARAVPIGAPEAAGALLVLHDVTALRRADVVRRDFVANVSHELRTPLTAIRGYLEALRDTDPSLEEARRFVEIITRHAGRMERLVQDLLRLARLEAGQERADLGRAQMSSLIAEVVNDLSPALDARHQRLAVRIAPTAEIIRTDIAKLQDVLRNLIENAVNYGPERGVVSIGAESVDGAITITVADQGPGIPANDLQRVFERFYRGTSNRADAPPGTGLGLSIVKHLLGLIGGSIRADNRASGGALFTITLPTSLAAGRPEAPTATTTSGRASQQPAVSERSE